jgi:exopolyphosphatase/guanosine-5'-triphosphate,3'-diphosphate pyrophosphatase
MADAPEDAQLAALDLGSNSFHLLVAQQTNGRIQVVDRIKEMVRLAEGLDDENRLSEPVAARALSCLERFGQRLKGLHRGNVRVVGTNTLRRASNVHAFLEQAEDALGFSIEIISGREEARLIYLGVAHSIEDNFDRRLVVDIGGGSTELILGHGFDAERTESLHMGCVGMSRACFADGRIRQSQFKDAVNRAQQELAPVASSFMEASWDTAIGASGTIISVQEVLGAQNEREAGITLDGLEYLKKTLLDAKHIDKLTLPGLSADRAAVFPGGVAILYAIFETLGITSMQATSGALREGVIHDLLGRVQHQDIRENTVRDLCERYHVDQKHGRRVRDLAIALLAQVAVDWGLTDPNHQLLLTWAAELHEIGMDIAHSQYHKHGGYLLNNMDLPGFSRPDQGQLVALVRAHRRKFPSDESYNEQTTLLSVILRLAVLFHRNRTSAPLPHVAMHAKGKRIELELPTEWLDSHPLTRLDLAQETDYLDAIDIELSAGLAADSAAVGG